MNQKKHLIFHLRGWIPKEKEQSSKHNSANNTCSKPGKNGSGYSFLINSRVAAFTLSIVVAIAVDFFLGFLLSNSLITVGAFQDGLVIDFVAIVGVWGWAILQSLRRKSQQPHQTSGR
jgi:hypothetical protein